MNKTKLIIFSVLIILAFTTLFLINTPNRPPKREVSELFSNYKGRQGFTVISFPDFLVKKIIEQTDSSALKLEKLSNQKLSMMIFHEKEEYKINQDSINKEIVNFLDKKNFKQLKSKKRSYGQKHLYTKPHEHNWRESVIAFESDSSIFVFNLVNQLDINELTTLASTLEKERTSFE